MTNSHMKNQKYDKNHFSDSHQEVFVLVRVTVDPGSIPGKLGLIWQRILNGMTVNRRWGTRVI